MITRHLDTLRMKAYDKCDKRINDLQGGVKVPTGGKARERYGA